MEYEPSRCLSKYIVQTPSPYYRPYIGNLVFEIVVFGWAV
jgi:hypothetical protein